MKNFYKNLEHTLKITNHSPNLRTDLFKRNNCQHNRSVEDITKIFIRISQLYIVSSGHATREGSIEFLNKIKLSKFIEGLRQDVSFELHKFPSDNCKKKRTRIKRTWREKIKFHKTTENAQK